MDTIASRPVFRRTSMRTTLAAAMLGFAFAGGAAAAPANFALAVNYNSGGIGNSGWSEASAVTGDFNGDGRADVAVCDYFSGGAVRIMLGTATGALQSPGTPLAGTSGVGTLGAGDFNGDGRSDLLASNSASVRVYTGNPGGGFSAGASYAIAQFGQEDIVALDANADGRLDAAVITRNGFQVMLGNGNATFTLPAATVVPSVFPSAIDKARFDLDAFPDILLVDGAGQAIKLRGNGNGTFTQTGSGIAGFILGTGLAGDFNHDGIDDVVVLPEFNVVANAAVFISNASGGFTSTTPVFYDGGYAPVSGELADFDLDGHLDILASDTAGGQQVVLSGNGDGTFSPGGKFVVASSPQTPVVADFNLDGRPDIAVPGTAFGFPPPTRVSVLRNVP